MYDIIEKKRDKKELSKEEIIFFIRGICEKSIPDYQTSALLMSIYLNGLNERETADLTFAMSNSGDVVDLSDIKGIKVDKHSTGGVGDKTTLIVGPIVAALGVSVAKMSGRGLGHTGGTIDKLESIPGFHTSLSQEEFKRFVNEIKISIVGQTGNLAPADKILYALRDVTATVNNISLIASSIMSKKIASGADCIVLDVKTGSGAFMKSPEDSIELAKAMVKIAKSVGKKAMGVVTDMDVPLGIAIGNSLEVMEAIRTLKGEGPKDLENVSFALAGKMVELGLNVKEEQAKDLVREAVSSGRAINKFKEMIKRQGGDDSVVGDFSKFGKSKICYDLASDVNGYICEMITDELGKAAVVLGSGRETKESSIDFTAGIEILKKTGDKVKKGEVIARLYTSEKGKLLIASEIIKNSIFFSDTIPEKKPLILGFVSSDGQYGSNDSKTFFEKF
jgi:pyrimidine-nucleoside phosphorylase